MTLQTKLPGSAIQTGTISVTAITNFSGELSASLPPDVVSSSAQVKTFLPTNTVSSSAQVTAFLPTGTVSSSGQLPSGIASSSAQVTAYLPTNVVSSSAQVTAFLPTGTVSSSTQVDVFTTTGGNTLATTGSNTFTAVQTISDTTNSTSYLDGALHVAGGMSVRKDVRVSGSLTVNGLLTAVSMSTLYVTASEYTIGTSKVILNDDDLVRFAGISIVDSGSSSPVTASIYWDSMKHKFIYENLSGSAYNSAILIAGPKNVGTLGDEVGLTSGYVPYATGDDHISDSVIFQSGSKIGIGTTTVDPATTVQVVGSIKTNANVVANTFWPEDGIRKLTNNSVLYFRNAGGDSEVVINGSGNVGIGTTNPDSKLTVNGAAYISGSTTVIGNLLVGQTSNSSTEARIDLTAGGNAYDSFIDFGYYNTFDASLWNIGRRGSTGTFFISDYSTGLENNALTIRVNSCYVGIGTVSPANRLEVYDIQTTIPQFQIKETGSAYHRFGILKSGSLVHFVEPGNDGLSVTEYLMTMNMNGNNVGIGTSNPSTKLDILTAAGANGIRVVRQNTFPVTGYGLVLDSVNDEYSNYAGIQFNAGGTEQASIRQENTGNIYFDSRVDTYLRPAGSLIIRTNNTERMRITDSGNVGIGTTNPARMVEIYGAALSADTPTLRISSADASGTRKFGIELYSRTGADVRGKILADNNGRVYIDDNGSGGIVLQANGGGGNVGIGTTNPDAKFDSRGNAYFGVNGTDGAIHIRGYNSALSRFVTNVGASGNYNGLRIDSNVNNSNSLSNWAVDIGGFDQIGRPGTGDTFNIGRVPSGGSISTHFLINSSGNVGIGLTNPSYKLDVSGSLNLYGGIRFNNDATAYYITGPGNGGAIRIRSNIGSNVDRNVQFGNVDNNGVWVSYMTVAEGGSIGIGTTSPAARFEIAGGMGTNPRQFITNTDVTVGNRIGGLYFYSRDSSNNWYSGIDAYVPAGSPGVDRTDLRFYTTNVTPSERMRITAGGNVGIGTTDPQGSLDVAGQTIVQGGVYTRRLAFSVPANANRRIRVALPNYTAVRVILGALRTNSGDSVVYWEGVLNVNDNTAYSTAFNSRTSSGTISYTLTVTSGSTSTFDFDFNNAGSSGGGTITLIGLFNTGFSITETTY